MTGSDVVALTTVFGGVILVLIGVAIGHARAKKKGNS